MASKPASQGAYIRIRELARGGMGRVDLVLRREGRFERLYAVKRMRASWEDDLSVRAMFLEEARIAGLVRHPNVVSVVDVGEDEEGPYLVMDYVEGVPLSNVIQQAAAAGEQLPVLLCVEIARQAALGLHAAHELVGHDGKQLGLVHRDISPQNILIGFDGTVRVTDFGIAKAVGGVSRTTTGVLKGKVGYLSPEQLSFEPLDRRADLFSLGILLYEMLKGDRLYRDVDTSVVARRILNEPPPDIGEDREDVPADLVALLFELLAKDREIRPATASEVARRMREVAAMLELEQGPSSIEGWLQERFEDWRQSQRSAVAQSLDEARRTATEAETRPEIEGVASSNRGASERPSSDGAMELPPRATPVTATFGRFVRTGRGAWVAAGLVVILLGGATALWRSAANGAAADQVHESPHQTDSLATESGQGLQAEAASGGRDGAVQRARAAMGEDAGDGRAPGPDGDLRTGHRAGTDGGRGDRGAAEPEASDSVAGSGTSDGSRAADSRTRRRDVGSRPRPSRTRARPSRKPRPEPERDTPIWRWE